MRPQLRLLIMTIRSSAILSWRNRPGAETAFSLRTEYDLSEMGYDDQNYVLMYPWPYAGTSGVSGDEVTYTIGTREGDGYVQKDVFEGIYN